MDDEQLGRKIWSAWTPGPSTKEVAEQLGAAARAALTGPEVTREDVEERAVRGLRPGNADLILAALRHFARAPAGKVPSLEEIEAEMRGMISGGDLYKKCARVAHAMMQKIGGRERMMIDGMTEEEIRSEIYNEHNKINGALGHAAARVVYRLATTPRTGEDADKEAMDACWKYQEASGMKRHLTREDAWAHQSLDCRNGWRAVAKEKA
jgi:hypothetical protein